MIFIEIERNGFKVTPGDPESEKTAPHGEQKGANWAQKRAKRKPKGSQREPKKAKWSQMGAKSEPKGDQNPPTLGRAC